MAARDRWERSLSCPKCGLTGPADISENDYPFMRRPDRTIDYLSNGFRVVQPALPSAMPEIHCSTCNVKVS
ncbi:hypothetical protein D3C85_906870 [compost metagenome]